MKKVRLERGDLSSDSDSGDDADFFLVDSSSGGSSSTAGSSHDGDPRGKHGILADCDFLRQRNADLQREIDRIKGLTAERQEVIDLGTRRPEIVWGSLPPRPWSLSYYLTFRGFEYLQLYLWIIRDLGWAYGEMWFYASAVFGGLAVVHAIIITFRNFWLKDPFESCHSFLRLCWVTTMYRLLMCTITTANNFRIEPLYVSNSVNHGRIPKPQIQTLTLIRGDTIKCLCAIFALSVPLMILKFRANRALYPFKGGTYSVLGRTFQFVTSPYEGEGYLNLTALKYLGTWRDVENLLLWFIVGRDLGFVTDNRLMWAAFAFGALLIAMMQVHLTFNLRPALVEHGHYMSYFLWLGGITVYELGHGYLRGTYSAWDFVGTRMVHAELTCNEWAGIILVASSVPLGIIYIIWIVSTLIGRIAPSAYPDAGPAQRSIGRLLAARGPSVGVASGGVFGGREAAPKASQTVPLEQTWLEANKGSNFAPV